MDQYQVIFKGKKSRQGDAQLQIPCYWLKQL
jgi:hypothetical protein